MHRLMHKVVGGHLDVKTVAMASATTAFGQCTGTLVHKDAAERSFVSIRPIHNVSYH